jgi:hypothetical protein
VYDEGFLVGAVLVEVTVGKRSHRDVAEFCEASLLELFGQAGVDGFE